MSGRLRFGAVLAACLMVGSGGAQAQSIVSAISEQEVAITSSFAGTTLTLSGNIEPFIEGTAVTLNPPYDVITVVRGPLADRVVRQKSRTFGVWINTAQVLYTKFPAFFRVLASRPVAKITDIETLLDQGITPESQTLRAVDETAVEAPQFSTELLRLMHKNGLYHVDAEGIVFISPTFYTAQIDLPANVPNGRFVAQTYLFKNGELLHRRSDAFLVRAEGFEQFLGVSAHRFPLLYGLGSALLAIFTGWLGGVLFRR